MNTETYTIKLDRPLNIKVREMVEKDIPIESFELLQTIENFQQKTVRALVRFNGITAWVNALVGKSYEDNVDYSQADLENAIAEELKAGRYEG